MIVYQKCSCIYNAFWTKLYVAHYKTYSQTSQANVVVSLSQPQPVDDSFIQPGQGTPAVSSTHINDSLGVPDDTQLQKMLGV